MREIERKFLVDRERWTPKDDGAHLVQGYLSSHPERVVRVRVAGDSAKLTIKGLTTGVSREEIEYDLLIADARTILATMCERPLIDKHRYVEIVGGKTWEIDVFHGDNDGLVVAEIELSAEDEIFERPPWLGEEVSHDPRYFNASLLRAPFTTWHLPPKLWPMMTPPLSTDQLDHALQSEASDWNSEPTGTLFDLWCRHVGIEPNTYESAIAYAAFSAARDHFMQLTGPRGPLASS